MADYTKLLDHYLYDLSEDADLIAEAIATLENLFDHRDRQELMYFSRPTAVSYLALKKAQKLLKDQQHEIWELQELNEHLEDKLKEREAVEPTLIREGRNKYYNDYVCPRCDNEVAYKQNYCSECGVQFLWEGR